LNITLSAIYVLQAGPLLKLQCPCMFVTGEKDPLCPAERLTATQQEMSCECQNIQIQVQALAK
jgi:pimeloyl-ACP methyl ester carboxylesterase